MPSGTLPVNGYLGDEQRTTAEFQGGIDELLAYVNTLKAEIDVISDTVIKEAAVRGVGTGETDLVETSQLNTRLGTTGNLSGLEGFNPSSPTMVWSGSETIVDLGDLSDSSAGFYLVRYDSGLLSTNVDVLLYKTSGEQWTETAGAMDMFSAGGADTVVRYEKVQMNENSNGFGSILVRIYTHNVDTGGVSSDTRPILEVYKI